MLERLRSKATWLAVAELLDAYRLAPRLLIAVFLWEAVKVSAWFRTLEAPTTEQAAYVGAIWAVFTAATKFYVETGRDWATDTKGK